MPVLNGSPLHNLPCPAMVLMTALYLLGATATAAELLIEQVTIVSPQQQGVQPKQNVLVRDGRIVTVGPKAIVAARDAAHIDGRGKFLTPGVMDSHVHVSYAPESFCAAP